MKSQVIGEVRMFALDFTPRGWIPCDGSMLNISSNQDLFQLIGIAFGGDGQRTFGVPNLPPVQSQNGGTLRYLLSNNGSWPQTGLEGFIGEVRLFLTPGPVLPSNWVRCDGQVVPSTTTLAATLGTTYGGTSGQTVGIPKLTPPAANMSYILCLNGVFPPYLNPRYPSAPTDAYISEAKGFAGFAGSFTLTGYDAITRKLSLPVRTNAALFSLLTYRYGGQVDNFDLPQLAPIDNEAAPVPYFLCVLGIYPPRG